MSYFATWAASSNTSMFDEYDTAAEESGMSLYASCIDDSIDNDDTLAENSISFLNNTESTNIFVNSMVKTIKKRNSCSSAITVQLPESTTVHSESHIENGIEKLEESYQTITNIPNSTGLINSSNEIKSSSSIHQITSNFDNTCETVISVKDVNTSNVTQSHDNLCMGIIEPISNEFDVIKNLDEIYQASAANNVQEGDKDFGIEQIETNSNSLIGGAKQTILHDINNECFEISSSISISSDINKLEINPKIEINSETESEENKENISKQPTDGNGLEQPNVSNPIKNRYTLRRSVLPKDLTIHPTLPKKIQRQSLSHEFRTQSNKKSSLVPVVARRSTRLTIMPGLPKISETVTTNKATLEMIPAKRMSTLKSRQTIVPGIQIKTSEQTSEKPTKQIPAKRATLFNLNANGEAASSSKQTVVSNAVENSKPNASSKTRKSMAVTSNFPKRTTRQSLLPINEKYTKSPVRQSRMSNKKVATPTLNVNYAATTSTKLKSPRKSMTFHTTRKSIASSSSSTTIQNSKKSSTAKFVHPLAGFKCNICDTSFRLSSSLISHKKSHAAVSNMCQYCDKKFAFKNALDTHQKDNCQKISYTDRKKLLSNGLSSKIGATSAKFAKPTSTTTTTNRSDIDSSKNSLDASCASDRSMTMRNTAHFGVYRTPSKPILCNICKINLPDILAFTAHVETHSIKNGKKIEFMDEN